MKKALALIVLVAVLMPAGVASLAQVASTPPASSPLPRQLMLMPRPPAVQAMRLLNPHMALSMARLLNLSDAQKTQVTELLLKADEAIKPKVETQRKAMQAFVVTMADGAATEAALNTAAEKAAKAELAIVAEKVKTLLELRALLTEQQKPGFSKYIEDMTRTWRDDGGSSFGGAPTPPPAPTVPEAKPDQGAK